VITPRGLARGATLLFLLAAACSRPATREAAGPAPALRTSGQPDELTYAPALGVQLDRMTRTATGLYFQDLLAGNGPVAAPGTAVWVNYAGWLADGTLFDRSEEGRPLGVRLGQGHLIPGWEEGVAGMRVGGRRLLVIPPALAYGRESPAPSIPPNATLVFDIQLVRVAQ
jgi:peptidylprolyl isomerase